MWYQRLQKYKYTGFWLNFYGRCQRLKSFGDLSLLTKSLQRTSHRSRWSYQRQKNKEQMIDDEKRDKIFPFFGWKSRWWRMTLLSSTGLRPWTGWLWRLLSTKWSWSAGLASSWCGGFLWKEGPCQNFRSIRWNEIQVIFMHINSRTGEGGFWETDPLWPWIYCWGGLILNRCSQGSWSFLCRRWGLTRPISATLLTG